MYNGWPRAANASSPTELRMPIRTSHSHTLLFTALLLARPLAAWADGVPVGPASTDAQLRPTVGSDGRGGAIVRYQTASLLVGALHVSGTGAPDRRLPFWAPK